VGSSEGSGADRRNRAFLASSAVVLLKFKFLFSMFVSAAVVRLDRRLVVRAIGLVVLLFVHEMGHVLEAKRQDFRSPRHSSSRHGGADHAPRDAAQRLARGEARDRRPAARLGRRSCPLRRRAAYDSNSLKALAFLGFFINLFNLSPLSHSTEAASTAALHPALWLVGFLALLGLVIWKPNPILLIILLFSASELWRRWKMRRHPRCTSTTASNRASG